MDDLNPPVIPDGVEGYAPLHSFKIWDENFNDGDVGGITKSLLRYGYNRTISRWQDDVVMAGNHTLLALLACYSMGKVPFGGKNIIVKDDDWYILFSDCSHLTKEEALAYAIADNEWARNAARDEGMLLKHLVAIGQVAVDNEDMDLILGTGFDEEKIALLAAAVEESIVNDDLDNLGDETGETGAGGDDINSNFDPMIKVQVTPEVMERWNTIMKGAAEDKRGERLGEILSLIKEDELSWW
jgi:hypothetical protein